MNFHQINTFRPSFPPVSDDDKFGSAVALSACGNLALVGSLGHDMERGRVHFFKFENKQWIPLSSFCADSLIDYDIFGISVAMSSDGTMALIGASGRNKGRGTVFYFTRDIGCTQWVQQSIITASTPASSDNDQFGISVAMSADGTKALIASTHQNFYGKNRGLIYYFTRNDKTWTQQNIFGASDKAADNDEFGTSLALSADGTMALVGAEKSCCFGHRRGIVYMFTRSDNLWIERSNFGAPPSLCSDGDAFGCSVALSADASKAVIGAYEYGFCIGKERGIAYHFTRQGTAWTYQNRFYAENPQSSDGDEFGVSVTMSAAGEKVLVGAHFQGGHSYGRVYTFELSESSYYWELRNSWLWRGWFQ